MILPKVEIFYLFLYIAKNKVLKEISSLSIAQINIKLCCMTTFPGKTQHTCLLAPDREPTTKREYSL